MKVMSLNARVPVKVDGVNHFDNRKKRIVDLLRQEIPDLVGIQECMPEGREWLAKELFDEYRILGCGRADGYVGEGTPIAFRKSEFELVKFESFWLSDTPDIPGSVYENSDQSKCPRIASAISLWHKKSQSMIRFVNTHLDHLGEEARKKELSQIVDYLMPLEGHKIITGDMNAGPDSGPIKLLLEKGAPMGIKDCTTGIPWTLHCYGNIELIHKIDFVFSDLNAVRGYTVQDTPVDGIYYSDHLAVCAELEI